MEKENKKLEREKKRLEKEAEKRNKELEKEKYNIHTTTKKNNYMSTDGLLTATKYDIISKKKDFYKNNTSFEILVEKDKKGSLKGAISKPQKGKPYGYNKKVIWEFMSDFQVE